MASKHTENFTRKSDLLIEELNKTKAALQEALKRIDELKAGKVIGLQQALGQQAKNIIPELLTTDDLVEIITERDIPKWNGSEYVMDFYNRVWKPLVDERIAYLDVVKKYDPNFARKLKNHLYSEGEGGTPSQYIPPKTTRGDKIVEVLGEKGITQIARIHRSRFIGRNS
jgi:hypothetical protein